VVAGAGAQVADDDRAPLRRSAIFKVVSLGIADDHQEPWLTAWKDLTEANRPKLGTPWCFRPEIIDNPSEFVSVVSCSAQRAEVEHDVGERDP
jgi:hypothetical protein